MVTNYFFPENSVKKEKEKQKKKKLKVLKRVKSSSYRSQTPRIKQKEGQLK